MANVLDQAENFSGGPVAAARKRESWLRRAANATDPEKAEQYREAAADLAGRYPEIEDLEIGEAERFARERGHGTGARSPVHGGRTRARPGTSGRRSTGATSASKDKEVSRGSQGRRDRPASGRSGPAGTPRVDRAIRQTGIPSSVESGTSVTMMVLGGTVTLSLLYLLLSSAEEKGSGGAALPQIVHWITGALNRFIEPKDFFPSNDPRRPAPHYNEAAGSPIAKAAARLRQLGENEAKANKPRNP